MAEKSSLKAQSGDGVTEFRSKFSNKRTRGAYKPRRARKMPCDWCLQDFEAKRYDARYCSQKCKQAAYRDRNSVTALASGV